MPRTLRRLLFAVAAFSLVSCTPIGQWILQGRGTGISRPLPPLPGASMDWSLPPESTFEKMLPALLCPHPGRAIPEAPLVRVYQPALHNQGLDYTEPSTSKRLFLIDLYSWDVTRLLVSHGKNSGKLYATRFSNRPDSLETPRGFFITGAEYYGPHGPSMVLYGLQKGINDNSYYRKIVMHGASYVSWEAIQLNRRLHGIARLGLSEGCPAIPMQSAKP